MNEGAYLNHHIIFGGAIGYLIVVSTRLFGNQVDHSISNKRESDKSGMSLAINE